MAEPTEPRALGAALAAPAFVTKAGGGAMHAAKRHVERWAPEANADRVGSLRNLSFVDRLVSPWIEAAQRSASLRLFSQYRSSGMPERPTTQTSWLFPRPWYQDELDWMAAARQVNQVSDSESSPTMLTTRGTFVAPRAMSMPTALYEFVAPSLSVARHDAPMSAAASHADAYSPLVPLAAVQAAHVAQRALAPLGMATAERMSPGLRSVLATMLQRTATHAEPISTRLAASAPELVTPPAPRAPVAPTPIAPTPITPTFEGTANELGAQHAQLVELQHAARAIATRELAARQAPISQAPVSSATAPAVVSAPSRAVDDALEARIAQRLAERRTEEHQHAIERTVTARREQRLHDAARESAARDARSALAATPVAPSAPASIATSAATSTATIAAPPPMQRRVPEALVHAIGALSPALAATVAATIAREPDRAAQTIEELTDALRTIELLARTTAAGNAFESTRGPRLVMPAGLGGLVASVEHTTPSAPNALNALNTTMTGATFAAPATARPMSIARAMRVPAMLALSGSGATSPGRPAALAAAEVARPAALQHVAWADRWLARFSGARKQSLDVFAASATPAALESRLAALAAGAPDAVFVAPTAPAATGSAARADDDTAPEIAQASAAAPAVMRFDDNAETPDDVFASIAAAARTARVEKSAARSGSAARAAAPAVETALMPTGIERETFADVVAHAVPAAPHAGFSAQLASSPFAPALRHLMPLAAAPSFDVRALFGDSLVATYLAGLMSPATRELAIDAPQPVWSAFGEPTTAPAIGDDATTRSALEWDAAYVAPGLEPATAESAETLTTMRSALLAWNVESDATGALVASPQQQPASVARSMALAMALPMIGELAAASDAVGLAHAAGEATPGTSYAAPGMIADRAHTWAVAQERSASDLALDFVTPELVLAARVYGLGPAEAAQAARLAIAGPGALATMASTVDRTFVQALAIEAERRERAQLVTAYPHEDAAQVAQRGSTVAPTASAQAPALSAAPVPAATTFGVDRRTPRGAFMWPAATVAALGLNAASPDGEQSMSVAALELLAAQAVAELGTYAALGERPAARDDVTTGATADAAQPTTATAHAAAAAAIAPTAMTAMTADAAIRASEPSDHDVLATAVAMVPTARRAKLEALYVALSQSSTGRSWSPAARAARALALAGRGDETISAHERASIAWDVLPVVAPIAGLRGDEAGEAERFAELAPGATRSTGVGARQTQMMQAMQGRRDGLALPDYVEVRPGLAALSARAGEALGSYVAPRVSATTSGASPSSSTSSAREVGAVLRAPTAAQEMVRTGRPTGRFGGGEVEIPTWFEAAARKMFEERSSGGPASELSLAELTLIAAAPAAQVAASTRSMPGAAPANPSPSSAGEQSTAQTPIDVEKIANDVYRQILVLMDAARFRNGEPYL